MMKTLSILFLFCLALSIQGQDESKKEKVYDTFQDSKVILSQTTEQLRKKQLDFRITHRFGNMGKESGGGGHTLFGLDAISNVRIGFDYGVTDNIQLGIGRSKTNEHIDGNFKIRILQQTKDNSIPVSVSWYSNAAFTPKEDIDSVFDKTAFRFSYGHQLIIARKFGERLSLQLLPTIQHRNLVYSYTNENNGAEEENTLYSLGVSGKLQLTKVVGITVDYYYTLSEYRQDNDQFNYSDPLAIGVVINTGGHLFQLNFTNASGIMVNDFIPNTTDTWTKGGFKMGFNISRVFKF
ncbi:MAG: DUF5777 family beta-barrel protein [Flavobacteriales bacterium]|nr:DUF5777 family beta-barrel protein [Flavobacteriales bacterium]